MPYPTEGSVAMSLIAYLLLPALVLVIFYARKRARQKLDAEFLAVLRAFPIEEYELLVDKVTTPSTNKSAEVYRIVRASQGHYFVYMKTGRSAGVLQPLSQERALCAVRANS